MSGNKSPCSRVFDIPELAGAVFQFVGPITIRSLRLVSRSFRDRCSPFFVISLDLANAKRYPDLQQIVDAAAASSTSADGLSILDQIQGLKLNGQVQSEDVASAPLASVLNRCRNLRHINMADPPGIFDGDPSAQSDPILLWPDLSNLNCILWSTVHLLPLEGTLLSRLESLTIRVDGTSPISLDNFFVRLSQSCAGQTLRTLGITGSQERRREFSFDAFQGCICALKALETVKIADLRMTSVSHPGHNDSQDPALQQQLQRRLQQRQDGCVALKVRTLALSGHIPPEIKILIMDLFPNVELLDLGHMDILLDSETERQVFGAQDSAKILPYTALHAPWVPQDSNNSNTLPMKRMIPFPQLKTLGGPVLTCNFLSKSLFLRQWIERQASFQLNSIHLQRHHVITSINFKKLVRIFTSKNIAYKGLCIETRCQDVASLFLVTHPSSMLRVLEINSKSIESVDILISAFKFSVHEKQPQNKWPSSLDSQPILGLEVSRESLRTHFQWMDTLTRLCISSGVDSRLDTILEPGSLNFMRLILRCAPNLVDFEMLEWITDLSLFEGLGRASKRDVDVDATEKGESVFPNEDEYPHLRRLVLFQLPKGSEKQLSWRSQLEYRFRFLEELVV